MLSIDDYMPHGKYAAHGQALLDLRDWSEQTGAELLIILTPGKNVDGKAYDGTKAFLNASNIRYADPGAEFLDHQGRTLPDLFWRFDSHLNSVGQRASGKDSRTSNHRNLAATGTLTLSKIDRDAWGFVRYRTPFRFQNPLCVSRISDRGKNW